MKLLIGAVFLMFSVFKISAKTNIYLENFGTNSVNFNPLISGTPTLSRSGNNDVNIQISTGTSSSGTFLSGLISASGNGNLADLSGTNPNYTGIATFSSISTIGYRRLELIYIARKTTTYSASVFLEWSSDGINWNLLTYTDVSNSGNWEAINDNTPIILPVATENQSNLRIRYRFERINGNGNYRIDDIILRGEPIKKTINFDNTGKWITGSNTLNTFALDHIYSDENFTFTGGPALRQGTTNQDGYVAALGAYAFRLQDATCSWTATYNACGTIAQFGFSVRRWAFNANTNWIVEYSINGGISWISTGMNITNTFLNNTSDWTVFSYTLSNPASISGGQFIIKISRIDGERIMIDDFTYTVSSCSNTNYYYRSAANGDWNNSCNWEISANGHSGWTIASCIPDYSANRIVVKSGHTISITSDLILDQLIIESGSQINWIDGSIILLNGIGEDLDIFGLFNNNVNGNQILTTIGSTIRIRSDGILRISTAVSGISQNYASSPSSGIFIWDSSAVFDWNNSSVFSASGQTYFPNAGPHNIPKFRVSSNIGSPLGGANDFQVNGVFEANGNLSFIGDGNLNFRNGLIGSGNLAKTSGNGNLYLTGADTIIFGGNGSLTLASSLRISTNVNTVTKLISNKIINGGQIRINNSSTLLAQQYELSGTGSSQLNSNSIFVTAHPNGINGTFGGLSGGIIWDTTRQQTVVFNRNGNQNSGTFPASLGRIQIINGSVLNLESNIYIDDITGNYFEINGNGSTLKASVFAIKLVMIGTGSLILKNGGKMHHNCLSNLDIEFLGNASTGVMIGNGDTIKCYNFTSIKNTSGGLTLNANTPILIGNDFKIDFSGGNAILTDNGNTLSFGDDLNLIGNTTNFNLSGTFKALANTGDNDFEIINAELNHLVIESSGDARPRFRNNVVYSQNITIKGNLDINTTSSRELFLNDINLFVKGNITNSTPTNRFLIGTSNIILNGTNNQTLSGNINFYNLTINKTNGTTLVKNNTNVSNRLTMLSGHINCGNYTIELGTSISNKGILNYTTGNIVGKLKRWFNSTNTGASSGLFPMGSNNDIKHVTIEFTSAPSVGGSLTVNIIESNMGNSGLPITVPSTSSCASFDITSTSNQAYWNIEDADGLTGGIYTITLEAEGFNIITDICELAILKRVGSGNWIMAGNHIQPIGVIGKPKLIATGVTGWSNFGFGGGDLNLLPIKFDEFIINAINKNDVKINWAINNIKNYLHFEIQRNQNDSNFKTIANIENFGNPNQINQFEFIDYSVKNGEYLYRIKLVDKDSNSNFSESLSISINDNQKISNIVNAFPNPVDTDLSIIGSLRNFRFLEIHNHLGKRVFSTKIEQLSDVLSIDFSKFPKGIYFLKLYSQSKVEVIKIIKK